MSIFEAVLKSEEKSILTEMEFFSGVSHIMGKSGS